jgi:hypothetical protein
MPDVGLTLTLLFFLGMGLFMLFGTKVVQEWGVHGNRRWGANRSAEIEQSRPYGWLLKGIGIIFVLAACLGFFSIAPQWLVYLRSFFG